MKITFFRVKLVDYVMWFPNRAAADAYLEKRQFPKSPAIEAVQLTMEEIAANMCGEFDG